MRKIDNLLKHDPDNGVWGDCHRVCFAMILGLEAEEVPHFYEEGPDPDFEEVQKERIKSFLRSRGLVEFHIGYSVSCHDDILYTIGAMTPDGAYILGGTSTRGCGHSVVCLGDKIFHDPTGSGIVGPMKDGYFWVTIFSPISS